MFIDLKNKLQVLIEDAVASSYPEGVTIPSVEIETPSDKKHGELSCNVALKSAKILKKAPAQIAQEFISAIQNSLQASDLNKYISKIEFKNPGFINFFFSQDVLYDVLQEVFEKKENYGRSKFGANEKIQVEFVSANPTGPLSVAHARQAVVGDVFVNILNYLGFDAVKEFYVNDEGNQINILGNSIMIRALEIFGESVDFPKDGYQGEYIKEMAQIFIDQKNIKDAKAVQSIELQEFIDFGVNYLLDVIKKDLNDFHVNFDVWSHQSKIANNKEIEKMLKLLDQKELSYEEDGALWFKSTKYGDDKDRVIRKSDGFYTYLTPDIVYHKDKYDRKFSRVFNIWGPDHHGYIPRIKASIQALGREKEDLEVLIVQLATIYKGAQVVSMSTRRGQYISLREVIDEVGVDVARFFFLMRHINVHLDFDLELAKKESPENPVFYIQYAHARIHSINKKAQENNIIPRHSDFSLLKEAEEIDLIKKLGNFPEALMNCYRQLDPFTLISYLQELATCFHRFYDKHRVVDDDKNLSTERLGLINAVKIVLANGLSLLGVSIPEKM